MAARRTSASSFWLSNGPTLVRYAGRCLEGPSLPQVVYSPRVNQVGCCDLAAVVFWGQHPLSPIAEHGGVPGRCCWAARRAPKTE
jgi:hypothetical protein